MSFFYTAHRTPFRHHVGASLQRRLKIFIGIICFMAVMIAYDLYNLLRTDTSATPALIALLSVGAVVLGGAAGFITVRVFHISWNEDAKQVIGRIDAIGGVLLAIYIAIEIARSYLFGYFLPDAQLAATIGFVFIAAALTMRVIGMRRRIVDVLHEQQLLKRPR